MHLFANIEAEAKKSRGRVSVTKVSKEKQPSREELRKLDRQIRIRVEKSEAVCYRSINSSAHNSY